MLTLAVTVTPLVFALLFLLTPRDPYGYGVLGLFPTVFFFAPMAVGWWVGVGAVVLTRRMRMKRGPAL